MEITVVGTSLMRIPPQRAVVALRGGFEGEDLAAVVEGAADLSRRMHAELTELNRGPVTWFSMLPISTRHWRPYSDSGQVMALRHESSFPTTVRFQDFQALSQFVSDWGGADGVTIDGVEWELTEEELAATQAQTLARAVDAARARAEVIATAAGAGSVTAVEIADAGLLTRAPAEPIAYAAKSARFDGGQEAAAVVPRDIEVEATVHARFTTA